MVQQFDELLGAIKSVLQGKLHIRLINPVMLQNRLRNVSLHLPERYELVAGTRINNIHLYYELATVTLVGNTHGIKIIVNVPLKTASQQFTLYKIIVLHRECLIITLLNIRLTFHILALMTVIATTSCLQKHTGIVSQKAASLCSQHT
jgi:hypothetical protein